MEASSGSIQCSPFLLMHRGVPEGVVVSRRVGLDKQRECARRAMHQHPFHKHKRLSVRSFSRRNAFREAGLKGKALVSTAVQESRRVGFLLPLAMAQESPSLLTHSLLGI